MSPRKKSYKVVWYYWILLIDTKLSFFKIKATFLLWLFNENIFRNHSV